MYTKELLYNKFDPNLLYNIWLFIDLYIYIETGFHFVVLASLAHIEIHWFLHPKFRD